MEVMKINSAKLKQLREANVLTMKELAERSGVSDQTIYELEHQHHGARPSTIRKLAGALGVEPQELISK